MPLLKGFGQAGSPETAFGGGYKNIKLPLNAFQEFPKKILQQTDGKLLVVSQVTSLTPQTMIARFHSNGVLDRSFGVNGFSNLINVVPTTAALQSDGKIVVAGYPYSGNQFIAANKDFTVARFNSDGSIDNSFSGDGIATKDLQNQDVPTSIAIQPDGKILLAGYSAIENTGQPTVTNPAMARFNPNGSDDPTFFSGIVNIFYPATPYPTNPMGSFKGIALLPNGKFIVCGDASNSNSFIGRFNADGTKDNSFSDDGWVFVDFSLSSEQAADVIIQPDGKIVLGVSDGKFIISRFNNDGSRDAGFAAGGQIEIPFSGYATVSDLALTPAGQIIATGWNANLVVSVLRPDGYLDNTFSDDGKLEFTLNSGTPSLPVSLIVQTDSKIAFTTALSSDIGMLRLNANGIADNSFNGDGQLRAFYSLPNSKPNVVKILPDNKTLVVGSYNPNNFPGVINTPNVKQFNQFEVARYNENGSLDASFSGGKVYRFLGTAYALAIIDGKYLVGGGNQDATMAMFNSDGTPDNSFGTGGQVFTDFGGTAENIASIAALSGGKFLVCVKTNASGSASYILARYNGNGSLDNSFNGTGKLSLAFGGLLQVRPNGKIVIGGTLSSGGGNADFAIAQYNADGTPDLSFSDDGKLTTDFGSGYDTLTAIALQDDGKLVGGGAAHIGTNDVFAVARYNADGSLDQSFDGDGKVTIKLGLQNDRAFALKTQADGKIVIGGETEINNAGRAVLVRLAKNGVLDPEFDGDGKVIAELYGEDFDPGMYFNSMDIVASRMFVTTDSYSDKAVVAGYRLGDVPTLPTYALNYRYYEGTWTTLPDFNALAATNSGTVNKIDFSPKPATTTDHFGFVWEGKIKLPSPGTYTFEIVSDDGSRFYFNKPYSYAAVPTINNDGVHSATSSSANVTVDAAGFYPFALTYFEGVLDETLQFYWSGPGFSRQLVPPSAFTDAGDSELPTTPLNVRAVNVASTFAYIDWNASTDNYGVVAYDVVVIENRSITRNYVTTNANITLDSLLPNTLYTIYAYARDAAGNRSASSNITTLTTDRTALGLKYRYYEGDWNQLPDFNALTPLKTGSAPNVDLGIRKRDDYFGVVWEGKIRIPTAGNYTFEILSDDGSKFYFNSLYSASATPTINNDGAHYALASGTVNNVSAGLHSFALAYFEKWGGETMQIYWTGSRHSQTAYS